MNTPQFKRNIYKTNPFERKMLKAIFFYATLPVIFVILFFYCIFSDLISEYVASGLPQAFPHRFTILSLLIVAYYLILCRFVFKYVNRIVGFYPRLLKELDDVIAGRSTECFHLRKGDYATELVERINRLIQKCLQK